MKASSVFAAAGFLLATLPSETVSAQDAEFVLANNTGFRVFHVYYWPVTVEGPGPDRLGDNYIPSGSRVTFTPREEACSYHIRVKLEDNQYKEWNSVNLCGLSSIMLNYDYLSEELWASTSTSRSPNMIRSNDELWSGR